MSAKRSEEQWELYVVGDQLRANYAYVGLEFRDHS